MSNPLSKYWVWTLNNPNGYVYNFPDEVEYAIYQLEISRTGTLHDQGFIALNLKQRISFLKKFLPVRAFIEKVRNLHAARQYVMKENSRIKGPYTYGIIPKNLVILNEQKNNIDKIILERLLNEVKNGLSILEIARKWPEDTKRYESFIREAIGLIEKKENLNTTCLYLYGDPGTGKDVTARSIIERLGLNPYTKADNSDFFERYDGHDAIIFSDYRSSRSNYIIVNSIMDGLTPIIPLKGKSAIFNASFIVFTSNVKIEDVYGSDHVSTRAFTRRLCGEGYFYTLADNINVVWDFYDTKRYPRKKKYRLRFTYSGKYVYNASVEMGKVVVYDFIYVKKMPTLKYSTLEVIIEPNIIDDVNILYEDNDPWINNDINDLKLINNIKKNF